MSRISVSIDLKRQSLVVLLETDRLEFGVAYLRDIVDLLDRRPWIDLVSLASLEANAGAPAPKQSRRKAAANMLDLDLTVPLPPQQTETDENDGVERLPAVLDTG